MTQHWNFYLVNIGIGIWSVSADMKKRISVIYRIGQFRKWNLSVYIGIGRYEKKLIGRTLVLCTYLLESFTSSISSWLQIHTEIPWLSAVAQSNLMKKCKNNNLIFGLDMYLKLLKIQLIRIDCGWSKMIRQCICTIFKVLCILWNRWCCCCV